MRGILYRQRGRIAEARQDWLKVLQLAPASEEARTARANIEKLDVAVESQPDQPQR
jgi:Flp pilus assembly protein TadD